MVSDLYMYGDVFSKKHTGFYYFKKQFVFRVTDSISISIEIYRKKLDNK